MKKPKRQATKTAPSPKRVDVARKAENIYICGATGSGKSTSVKQIIRDKPRVLVFDPDDEYADHGFIRITHARDWIALLKRYPRGALKATFVAEGEKAFNFWCRAVFIFGNCVAVAEEIADVTSAGKAPPDWGRLIRRGRKYGIQVISVTQRPAEADKTCLTQAAKIRCGMLGRDSDRVKIAKEIDVPVDDLYRLKQLEYFEFDRAQLKVKKGRLVV